MKTAHVRVRFTLFALVGAAIGPAVRERDSPTVPILLAPSPTPGTGTSGGVDGTIWDTRPGNCLRDATIEIVTGSRNGWSQKQGCDNFALYGDGPKSFGELPLEPVTLLASHPGYLPQEKVVTPVPGIYVQVDFPLSQRPRARML